MSETIVIDGSLGEGGGQILRTSLALSLVTGRPLRLERIRARRRKPGLRAQHQTCVRAAAQIGQAEVEGDTIGSQEVRFVPRDLVAGDYYFDLGTAGSTGLVLQTVLPALIQASATSTIQLRGGTHNPLAPPFEFLDRVYLPLLHRMGPHVEATLDCPGFYPKGGGRVRFTVEPAGRLEPLELLERGPILSYRAEALVSRLPESIARRELEVVSRELDWAEDRLETRTIGGKAARGPGNALLLSLEAEHAGELVSSFGERGVPAETVAQRAVDEMRTYLDSNAPVGQHLADQLLLLLSLAGGGRFRTGALTMHTRTQMEIIPRFLPVEIEVREDEGTHELTVLSAEA